MPRPSRAMTLVTRSVGPPGTRQTNAYWRSATTASLLNGDGVMSEQPYDPNAASTPLTATLAAFQHWILTVCGCYFGMSGQDLRRRADQKGSRRVVVRMSS